MLTALLLAAVVVAPASSARQDEAGVAGEPGRVSVSLGAVDREGRPVEGLKAEDLRVTVEGAAREVVSLTRGTGEPLHVVVMLDASASQEGVLPFVQGAADRLVPALLAGGANGVAVVSFTGGAKVVQGLTADEGAVRRAVASVEFVPPPGYVRGGVIVYGKPPGRTDPAFFAGSTALWDSLVAVCEQVFARARPGRRAVVLVTDGVDTSSSVKPDKAVERLTRDGVAVYGVGIGDEREFAGVDRDSLRKLSERTGGRAVFPKKAGDLPAAFEQLRRELLTPYALTFAAPAPRRGGKPLRLRVEVVNPELRRRGVRLAHPQSLFGEAGRP